eukprot:2927801-Prymnesium_polylepis.1
MLALSSTVVVSYVQQPVVRAAAGVRSSAAQMSGKGDEFTLAILGDLHVRPPVPHLHESAPSALPCVRARGAGQLRRADA